VGPVDLDPGQLEENSDREVAIRASRVDAIEELMLIEQEPKRADVRLGIDPDLLCEVCPERCGEALLGPETDLSKRGAEPAEILGFAPASSPELLEADLDARLEGSLESPLRLPPCERP